MADGPKTEQDSGNETLENYLDGIFSSALADQVESEEAVDREVDRHEDEKAEAAPRTVELRRQNSSSSVSSSGSSSTYSIEISRTSPLISFSSNAKKTRNKWKASEDFALLGMVLNYSHLLTFVEYFKPMKKFWGKISQALNEQYGFERNARQCHDRFKVLYAKALKIQDDIDEDDTYSGTLNSESKQLLLQIRNTFTFCKGNITLKSQPAVAGGHPAEAAASASNSSTDNPDLRQQPHDGTTETERNERETMHSYIFHVLSNLQEQIDLLRSHLRATDRKTQELASTLQDLISATQYSLPETVSFANASTSRPDDRDDNPHSHLPQPPRG
ncbi:hypothetical protein HG536_0B03020 [Torulaspora globosa]|uniref:Myb-like domain-containing protein n=1 Tax=Torulaspora globosa TaxID=48254 RepID=A0A7G3ZD53_9SACH|nr:uncharacterized protein HG536_0B03020 [Torulaspora globosa]QLL31439.1 hypothetical protein HG536_0B03020 [Torulaspora globosa]